VVPEGFVFAVKASRYITHMKKLKDPEKPLATFLRTVTVLGDKLGPILFQLPPRWRFNPERLEDFLGSLSPDYRYTFEFRDTSWFNDETHSLLAEHDLSKLPGIGKDRAGKIKEIVETGTLKQLKEIEGRTSSELSKLMKVEGLGPKRSSRNCWPGDDVVYCYYGRERI
jgi:uncharacterized protein YecE (DUF72 family)